MNHFHPVLKTAMISWLFLCPILQGSAQTAVSPKVAIPATHSSVKPYTVGDKLPDIEFKRLVNYSKPSVKLSQLKGKLVIIDFWEMWCGNCIVALGKLQKLQQQFGDKVQIISVTKRGTGEELKKSVTSGGYIKEFTAPTVTGDDLLYKYFPFELVSHVVWIDGNGVVKGITGTDYLSAENIQGVLAGVNMPWPIKKDVIGYDFEKPLLTYANADAAPVSQAYYSALGGYVEGIDATDKVTEDSVNQTVTYNHFNRDILTLCDGALNGSGAGYIYPKYLILEAKDSTRFIRDEKKQYYDQWAKKNVFTYSVTLPLSLNPDERKEFIADDLTRWMHALGVLFKKEKREMPCMDLIKTGKDNTLLAAKGGRQSSDLSDSGEGISFKNRPISTLTFHLNYNNKSLPWIFNDKTGLPDDFLADLTFTEDAFKSIPDFRKELQQYGLDLVESKCLLEVHVISEKGFERRDAQ